MVEMMTRQLVDNRLLRQTAGPALSVGLGTALGEIVSQDMMTGLLGNFVDRAMASGGGTEEQRLQFRADEMSRQQRQSALEFELQHNLSLSDFERDEILLQMREISNERDAQRSANLQENIDAGRLLMPEELNKQYEEIGLVFDRPTTPEEAKLLADGKKEEIIRNAIIDRAPQGVFPGIAKFGAGLVAMATDPLEIASMFIPVVGQAGKAAAVARFGRIGGRVAIGATEGLVGSALTEPIYYGLSRQAQLDYTMADALLNIGLGAVFGGGLGALAGTIGHVRGTADPLAVKKPFKLERNQRILELRNGQRILELTPEMRVNHIERAATAIRQFVNDQDVNIRPIENQISVPQSNGNPIPFGEWNAGNMATNAVGKPTTFYHGAGTKFEAFDMSKAGQNFGDDAGIFFTTDREKARQYANVSKHNGDGVGHVVEAQVSLKNPVIIDSGKTAPDVHWAKAVENGNTPDMAGHDGVIVRADNGEEMAIVFNPDNTRIINDTPTPSGVATAAADLAKHAQQPSRHANQEASQAFDDLAKTETTTEAALREEVEMLESMVEQLALANHPTPKLSMRGPKRPQTLSEFLRASGGINDADPTFSGELKHIGINPAIRNNGLNNPTSKLNLDDAAELAEQYGFMDERDPNALIELLRNETNGEFTFSVEDSAQAQEWRDYHDTKDDISVFIDKQQEARDMLDGLTPEQRASLEEIAAIETKAEAYAKMAEVAANCMART